MIVRAAACAMMLGGCSAAGWNAFAVAMSAPVPASSSPQYSRPTPASVVEDHRCFIAYVHGVNPQNLSPGIASDEARRAYWQPPGNAAGDFVTASSRQGQPNECQTLVAGYNSSNAFFETADEQAVASQIAEFIRAQDIPDERLVILAHSMGGLVVRHILNLGASSGSGADYQTVSRKTRYAITLGTPHLGSPGADALFVRNNVCTFFGVPFLLATGQVRIELNSMPMTTALMYSFSASDSNLDGETPLGDRRRIRTIYAVGGFDWRAGTHRLAIDRPLEQAWDCLGMGGTPGDGIVTLASAMGVYDTNGSHLGRSWSAGTSVQGPFVKWLAVGLNHNHIHFNDEVAEIRNWVTDQTTHARLGTYIAEHIGENGLEIQ